MMNHKKIRSLLTNALEREIPSSQIKLWQAIKADLATGKHSLLPRGEKMNNSKLPRLWQRAAYATVLAAFLFALVLITPRGRALAQSIAQFFTRTERDSYYALYEDVPFEDTTPFHAECGIAIAPRCSVEQVRSKVDFEIKELGTLPAGMYYIGATGGPDFIELKYGYPDKLDGNLSVIIEATGRSSAIGTGITAPSANVEPVQIGSLPGEYVAGSLFQDEQGNVNWYPDDPMRTLRWEDGDSTYTLFYYSTRYPLTKEDLVRLAESMIIGN
jgi:hypothetical protein